LHDFCLQIQELTNSLIHAISTFDDPNNPESISIVYSVNAYHKKNHDYKVIDKIESKLGNGYRFISAALI